MAKRSNLSRRQLEILSQASLFEEESGLVSVITQTKKSPICVPNTVTKQKSSKKDDVMEYRPRTLNQRNIARLTILSVCPSLPNRPEHDLLLCNVPMKLLNIEQRQRRQLAILTHTSNLSAWEWIEQNKINSPMVNRYQSLYVELSQRWHVKLPIIHYNLARMIKCAKENGFQFTDDDLSITLGFYLQMDVDMFNLKTCSFRDAQCTNNRMFCNSTKDQVQSRYGMKRCRQFDCLCCHSPQQYNLFLIKFIVLLMVMKPYLIIGSPVQHRISSMLSIVLVAKYDYVAHTNLSFAGCLTYHRQESHRILFDVFTLAFS